MSRPIAVAALALSAACWRLRAESSELADESLEYVAGLVIDAIRSPSWDYKQIAADPTGAVAAARTMWASLPSEGAL